MKILVISDIPPFVTGGAEMQALRLIDAWIAEGHEVQCIGRNLPQAELARPSGKLIIHSIPMIKRMGRYLKAISYFFSLAKFLVRNQQWPDVIYTRFLGDAAVTICLLKSLRLINIILISTPANAGATGDLFYIKSAPLGKLWLHIINKKCDAINLIAPQMLDDLKKVNITEPFITQIPNGVPIHQEHIKIVNDLEPISILSVGRLSPQKGYDIFLAALYQLKDSVKSFKVTIVGDGPEKEKLQQLVSQYSLQDIVHIIGERDQNEIKLHLQMSDIFVLPSLYEGMANAALEAMEAGKPLLLTNCGGLDTYIKPNMGWVANIGSVDSLHNCLLSALNTNRHELRKMGLYNREFAIERFAMKNIARQYLELFNSLQNKK